MHPKARDHLSQNQSKLTMNNPKKEIKKTIQFITASKRIKYLGTNLIQEAKLQNIAERN